MPDTTSIGSAVVRTAALLACVLLGACSSAPKENFYTLNPAAVPPPTAATANNGGALSIAVGPVRVPEIVDRPQLVVRRGPTQIDLLEQHRWAQPLRAEIAQAIASGLRTQLPGARVALDRDAAAQNADVRVTVDISRFDAVPGDAVTVQALWSVRPTNDRPPLTGQSTSREPLAGSDNEEIARAFARAVASVSRDIASSVAAARNSATAAK
ncbi:PqiC family protein [Noviherbaspirillum malthae]|uniref:PqiC family protein n=1 Tax=Noviherbaspirillum malthae TaxID=1260987 RepID=UPI0018901161|nr:PqiC family protein [Noviherbaspirillum malthae]